eukprot:TRINITY_DN63180_c0_g1_i1.p1 TRINITY_DN63180_c0_g1~~TRINITY_DN63180_c0_g1_i1.p1  ORF type:complete len:506 (-),score=97.06 TRINITY_DN63180_c0_g1_i1:121-1638(-)
MAGAATATAEELRLQITAARRELQEKTDLTDHLRVEEENACERQRLRRELDRLRSNIDDCERMNQMIRWRTSDVDADAFGPYMPEESQCLLRSPVHFSSNLPKSFEEVMNCSEAVVKGEFIWRIEGFSWLVNTLKQNYEPHAFSDSFMVGGELFTCVYHPRGGPFDSDQRGSLGIMHEGSETNHGVTFRYKIFIKHGDDGYMQWGAIGDECHPNADTHGLVFGPDVQSDDSFSGPAGRSPEFSQVGIFGLSHEELLRSHWVVNDALTAKFQLEVLPAETFLKRSTHKPRVEVPAGTLGSNFLSLLQEGRCSDVTFVVEDQRIPGHSQILSARSEVFDRLLNSGMRESVSKEIVIEDCDAATFKGLLHFLYTDDFDCIEEMTKAGEHPCRIALLQAVLAVSHRYQVIRLRLWCEKQLCKSITVDQVCSVLCQAHLYDAKQLEEGCLTFIKENMEKVVVTSMFGCLAKEWPEVMLKISIFTAGLSEASVGIIGNMRSTSRESFGDMD